MGEREKDTILVPYSMACSVWKVPFLPVMPWQMTRVFLSTNTAGEGCGADPYCRAWATVLEALREAIEPISLATAWRPIFSVLIGFESSFLCYCRLCLSVVKGSMRLLKWLVNLRPLGFGSVRCGLNGSPLHRSRPKMKPLFENSERVFSSAVKKEKRRTFWSKNCQ